MKDKLEIGKLMSGATFSLPLDFVTRTLAIVAIRGWGKTVAATVLAEEMCEAGLPWVAVDPVGVWWGLRCNPDGSPGGYPVLVLGGQHGDLPLSKDMGRDVADAILQENISCVLDLKAESKNTVRHFVGEFCDRLMELTPHVPRHVFIEEAPELIPQHPMGEQKRSLAAVDRLIRLGRNQGYGATLISQRYATVNKDALTQCESLLAGRMIGKTDRKAAEEWIAEVASVLFSNRKADAFVSDLAGLDGGHGWFLSPQWLDKFNEVQIRRRHTYHPGETRTVGQAPKQVQLSDVRDFVERFGKALKATPKHSVGRSEFMRDTDLRTWDGAKRTARIAQEANADYSDMARAAQEESERLRDENTELCRKLAVATSVIDGMRKHLEPQYRQLQALFADMEKVSANGGGLGPDAAIWIPWKDKLGAGPAKLIDLLAERGELTRVQLQTLSGYSRRSMQNHISALNSNQLIEKNGGKVKLRVP